MIDLFPTLRQAVDALGCREGRTLSCQPLPAPGRDRWPALGGRR